MHRPVICVQCSKHSNLFVFRLDINTRRSFAILFRTTRYIFREVRDSGWIGKIRLESGKILDISRIFPIFPEVVSETKLYVIYFRTVFRNKSINLFTFRFKRPLLEKNIFLIDSIWVCFHVWIRDETNRASLSTMCCGQLDEGPGRKTRSRPSACKTHLASGIASGLCNFFAVSLYRSCYL